MLTIFFENKISLKIRQVYRKWLHILNLSFHILHNFYTGLLLVACPVHVHDAAGESAVYYPQHEGTYFIAQRVMMIIAGLCRYDYCGMLN